MNTAVENSYITKQLFSKFELSLGKYNEKYYQDSVRKEGNQVYQHCNIYQVNEIIKIHKYVVYVYDECSIVNKTKVIQ